MATEVVIFHEDDADQQRILPDDGVEKTFLDEVDEDMKMFFSKIGGSKKELEEILRRTKSRNMPGDVLEKMGATHVKGILLDGASGCGKKLIARQLGKILRAHEPKIACGEEILKSHECFRKLFEAAEKEQKKLEGVSGLHIIIIDKMDVLFMQPQSIAGASVLSQLGSKFDQLDNILVVGIATSLDQIDERLMRPGRFEVTMEIGIPNEQDRLEILQIHCPKMIESNMIDVNLKEIVALTENFTGAELARLVNGAIAQCANRVEVGMATIDNIEVCKRDFMVTLENIKPMYGFRKEDLE